MRMKAQAAEANLKWNHAYPKVLISYSHGSGELLRKYIREQED